MKKIITIILLTPAFSIAQSTLIFSDGKEISRELIDIPAIILVVYLISTFILTIIKWVLGYRLKSKMIDKGLPDEIVKQFLMPENNDKKTQAMKSFIMLTGIGIGLTIISFFQPFGIHSAAIMLFSIAFSFLTYYYFIKQTEK